MRVMLNLVWLVFGGLLTDAGAPSLVGNVISFVLAGWRLALGMPADPSRR
jgi:uncharacterized membrane protein YccF (DUF307 family)